MPSTGFIKDYKPAEPGKCIEGFVANTGWARCESRLPS
jgi:hypothetical protein